MRHEICLAAGCFWGAQAYFDNINGVLETSVGYANSDVESPSYEQVCTGNTNSAEAVRIAFDDAVVSLPFILNLFCDAIDPTSLNKQGGDIGTQYRTGIYYTEDSDAETAKNILADLEKKYNKPIMVEVKKLENFYNAEQYHQDYLKKNPGGYCHISKNKIDAVKKLKDTEKNA